MQVGRLSSKPKALVFRIDPSLESASICSPIDFSIATTIFKAGVWTGMIAVVVAITLVAFLVMKVSRS
jgi:hypothetical protein